MDINWSLNKFPYWAIFLFLISVFWFTFWCLNKFNPGEEKEGKLGEITIDNILDDDQRGKIAAIIADGTIKDIMVIYRQDKHLIWGTTMTIAHTLGVLTVALDRVREMTQKGWE